MQAPASKTSVDRCVELALFSGQMLSRFPQSPVLSQLAARMNMAGAVLDEVHLKYIALVKAIIRARVDVRFADWFADNAVRMAQRAAELADGKVGGVIASRLYPDGITPIIKPIGATQVTEMRDLEGRYDAITAIWPQAPAEKDKLVAARKMYEEALSARREGLQSASDARTARDLTKEDFLSIYAEIIARVKAEYPRDRKMQDLFFDEVNAAEHSAPSAEAPPAGPKSAAISG